MYQEITQEIQVEVVPTYLKEQSNPEESIYVYTYRVKITNLGKKTAQLLSRHWIIKDGGGEQREVKGPGVIGEQPILKPGEHFEYSSFCPLKSPTGNMRGTYQMQTEDGEKFDIKIPLFFLRESTTTTATFH